MVSDMSLSNLAAVSTQSFAEIIERTKPVKIVVVDSNIHLHVCEKIFDSINADSYCFQTGNNIIIATKILFNFTFICYKRCRRNTCHEQSTSND